MHPNRHQLAGYLLGNLPEDDAAQVAQHLAQCDECEATIHQLDAVSDTLVEKLRSGPPSEPYAAESNCRAMVQAIQAIGQEASCEGSRKASPRSNAETLTQVGQYQLLGKLGEGGMGAVYKARHVRLDKFVALKVLPPERTQDEQAVGRFEREMRAVGKLSHPNIVAAHDAGEQDGTHFLVMELVEGRDLARLGRECGPLPVGAACELVRQAALGLEHAHQRGLVHRDVKPSNLMLARERGGRPQVKILDLGLALLPNQVEKGGELTASAQLMGTVDYMAPEQALDSHDVTAAADVYSLGATLYKLLCGEAPFSREGGGRPLNTMMAITTRPAPSIGDKRADCPPGLAAVVDRMLAKRPEERYATAAEVAAALEPFASEIDLVPLLARAAATDAGGPIDPAHEVTHDQRTSPSAETATGTKPGVTPGRRQPIVAICLAALAAAGILSAIVLTLQTPDGEVVVELGDGVRAEDVRIEIKGNGQLRVADARQGWTIDVAEGRYDVSMPGGADRFKLDKHQVVVERNRRARVTVTLKPRDDAPPATTPDRLEATSRDVAEWVIRMGGLLEVVVDGERREVRALGKLPAGEVQIYRISLHANQRVKDADFARLTAAKGLRGLEIERTLITDDALRHIAQVKTITSLHAYGTAITDAGADQLAQLTGLGYLNLDDTLITDDGLAHLKNLPQLGHLGVARTAVTSAGLAHVAEMRSLVTVYLNGTAVDDEGLQHLAKLPRLRVLRLSHTSISDSGLAHLHSLKQLKRLEVQGAQVTPDGIAELKKARPECEVVFD